MEQCCDKKCSAFGSTLAEKLQVKSVVRGDSLGQMSSLTTQLGKTFSPLKTLCHKLYWNLGGHHGPSWAIDLVPKPVGFLASTSRLWSDTSGRVQTRVS